MYKDGKILTAKSADNEIYLLLQMANRHGLIAGATGTGKTVTLKVMAESFSAAGVPVFMADIKGDLSGTAVMGQSNENVDGRVQNMNLTDFNYRQFPVRFWDVYGEHGHSVRTTISEMGPTLLARILDLNDTQTGILNIVFRVADENGLLLLDIKDLRAMLQFVSRNAKELSLQYGNITTQSVSAIMRSLLTLEDRGGEFFFGEPAFDVKDWMQTSYDGKGFINIMHCVKLFQSPALYSTFMLWLLSELYEILPEVGDCDKPKMVFFFDEAHLLFDDAPKALLQKVEQVVRLIRSKGVGIYFVTQSPTDIPDSVLAQLGNKVQHALRAYTPAELKKVKAAAEAFRENPDLDTTDTISNLATGQALISFLDENGAPSMVQVGMILPPQSHMGAIDENVRQQLMASSGMGGKYDTPVDRESAYEILMQTAQRAQQAKEDAEKRKEERKEEAARLKEEQKAEAARLKEEQKAETARLKELEKEEKARAKAEEKEAAAKKKQIEKMATSAANSVARTVLNNTVKRPVTKNQSVLEKSLNSAFNTTVTNMGRQVSTNLVRGLLGNLLK